MDALETFLDQLLQTIGAYVPRLVGALAILVVGWLVARLLASLVRRVLERTDVDNRIVRFIRGGEEPEGQIGVEEWVSRGVFYLVMLLVLISAFQALRLTLITDPLNQLVVQIARYVPRLVGAGVLLVIAWAIATGFRVLVTRALGAMRLDERLGAEAGIEAEAPVPLSQTIGDAIYWLVFLLFLPPILTALQLEGLLRPVQAMLDEILGFLPNLFGAGVILLVGWFAARIVQRIVTNLMAAFGADRLSERVGLAPVLGQQKLSAVVGLFVYVLVFIPVLIAGLNTLGLDAITQPASNMLNTILEAIPALLGAGLVLLIAYIIARVVSGLITAMLTNIGFNNVMLRLGFDQDTVQGKRNPSEVAGYLVQVAIMLFAAIEASRLLGFEVLADIVAQFIVFAGQILLGLVILAVGLYLGNLAGRTVSESGISQSRLLGLVARIAIVLLAGAMALRQMGLANEIVNLAFGLILGAVAVALALSFGLGGREIAGRELEGWLRSIRSESE